MNNDQAWIQREKSKVLQTSVNARPSSQPACLPVFLHPFLSPTSYLLSLRLVLPLLMAFRVYVPSFTPLLSLSREHKYPMGQKSGVKQEA